MADELAAVVMAAGIGTRMKSATPKHLHPILGRRMVDWVVDAARGAGVERLVVVGEPDTLADAHEAEAPVLRGADHGRLDVEALAVVLDLNVDLPAPAVDHDTHVRRIRVIADVRQALLDHAVDRDAL